MKVNNIDFDLLEEHLQSIMFCIYQFRDNNKRQGKELYDMLADVDYYIYNKIKNVITKRT